MLFSELRSKITNSVSWQEARLIHSQLELLVNHINEGLRHMCLFLVSGCVCFTVAIMVLTTLVPSDSEAALRYFILGTGDVYMSLMVALGCRFGGSLRSHSIALLDELELRMRKSQLSHPKQHFLSRRPLRYNVRSLRRRMLGIQLGVFTYMDEGLQTEVMCQILDNTVSWAFMTTISEPAWIFKPKP